MYATTPSSALLRASSKLRLHSPFPKTLSSPSPSSINLRYLSFWRSGLAALGPLRASPSSRHCPGWRSPVSLRAQIRTSSPLVERFERKISTMGMGLCFKKKYSFFMICFGWYLCVLGNFDDFRFFFVFWICEVGMDFGEKRVRFEWPKAIFFDVLHLLFVFGIRSFVFETSFFFHC